MLNSLATGKHPRTLAPHPCVTNMWLLCHVPCRWHRALYRCVPTSQACTAQCMQHLDMVTASAQAALSCLSPGVLHSPIATAAVAGRCRHVCKCQCELEQIPWELLWSPVANDVAESALAHAHTPSLPLSLSLSLSLFFSLSFSLRC